MTNIKKIGLSALAGALAMTSAHAGSISVSGNMEISHTVQGGNVNTSGGPLGQNNELTFTGSGELDNGITVAYKNTSTDTALGNDSELVFGNILGGTLAFQSTGSPLDGIDNKTPTAFKDAESIVGSIADVSGPSGDFGIRYTLADVAGTGIKLDYNYTPQHGSGDATGDEATSGAAGNGNLDAHDITLTGAVPGVEGLNVGAGYSVRNYDQKTVGSDTREDATAYATYAYGPVTIGYQVGAQGDSGLAVQPYKNTYIGISYAVSDDFSISYNDTESQKMSGNSIGITQDWDAISASYSMGGMTLNVADINCGNCDYTAGKNESARTISMTIAF